MNITKFEIGTQTGPEHLCRDVIILHTDLPSPFPADPEQPDHVILCFEAPTLTAEQYLHDLGVDVDKFDGIEVSLVEVLSGAESDIVNLYTDLPDPFPKKGIEVVLQFETPAGEGKTYLESQGIDVKPMVPQPTQQTPKKPKGLL